VSKQPKALRLADTLQHKLPSVECLERAAAELRRLHEAHSWQYKMAGERLRRIETLEAVNAELLAALKAYEAWADPTICRDAELRAIRIQIRAAIAKAEDKT
jgi:hypothetical protein